MPQRPKHTRRTGRRCPLAPGQGDHVGISTMHNASSIRHHSEAGSQPTAKMVSGKLPQCNRSFHWSPYSYHSHICGSWLHLSCEHLNEPQWFLDPVEPLEFKMTPVMQHVTSQRSSRFVQQWFEWDCVCVCRTGH